MTRALNEPPRSAEGKEEETMSEKKVMMAKRRGFEFPRRNCVDRWIPAERAIAEVVQQVEDLGCHPRLTDAVVLLQQARDAVSDWAEETGNVLPDDSGRGYMVEIPDAVEGDY